MIFFHYELYSNSITLIKLGTGSSTRRTLAFIRLKINAGERTRVKSKFIPGPKGVDRTRVKTNIDTAGTIFTHRRFII